MNDKQREYTVKEIERHQESIDTLNRRWFNGVLMGFSAVLAFSGETIGYYNDFAGFLAPILGTAGIMVSSIYEVSRQCEKVIHRQQVNNLKHQLAMDDLETTNEAEKGPQKTLKGNK